MIYQPPFLDCSYRDLVEKRVKKIMAEFDRSTEQAGGDGIKLVRAWLEFTEGYKRAMGSDRIPDTPRGVPDAGGFVAVREGLSRRGYSPQSLMKICWSNFMRVFESVSTRREG